MKGGALVVTGERSYRDAIRIAVGCAILRAVEILHDTEKKNPRQVYAGGFHATRYSKQLEAAYIQTSTRYALTC